ncbi:hypothetical protein GIB67_026801 [Kingdonia uniflora]|uniref:Uncharacterized protein n=1 Tax=Kingdonia uniflora TaxID=39325 RepID=A0A7J7MHF4_9MAGN|nr:hypothetical protein GIB67_026801 [Kingdonia uniflora]
MATIKKQTKKKSSKLNLSDLKTLGHNLLSSRAHINNLPLLLSFIKPSSPPQHALESLLSLQSFFTPILPDLPSSSSSKALLSNGNQSLSKDDPELVYNTWVRSKFEELVKSLIDITVSSKSEDTLKDLAMDAIMEFVKLGKGGKFQSAIYHKFICTIVLSILADDVLLDSLVSKFFKYIDVRQWRPVSQIPQANIASTSAASEKPVNDGLTEEGLIVNVEPMQNTEPVLPIPTDKEVPAIENMDKTTEMHSASENDVASDQVEPDADNYSNTEVHSPSTKSEQTHNQDDTPRSPMALCDTSSSSRVECSPSLADIEATRVPLNDNSPQED